MNKELSKTLTTALVQFIDSERPEGTMCCSNPECEALEQAFIADNFFYVETLVQRKLSRLTEFEDKLVSFALQCGGQWDTANEEAKKWSREFIEIAKKELLSYADESNPAIEATADLERTFKCNPDKLPKWLKDEIERIKLEARAEGYSEGLQRALERNYQFIPITVRPLCWEPGGTCTNPQMDCINCPRRTTGGFNTQSGTSTAKMDG